MKGLKSSALRHAITWSWLLSVTLMTGCAVTPQTLALQEMEAQRQKDLVSMFQSVQKIDHPLTLSEVVARALRYNLDHQVKIVEEAQALDLSSLDVFALLPKLAANAAYSGRNNFSASNSRSISTGTQSLEMSTSQDRDLRTADLGLTWNILDFGVSYFNARQNADRTLIAQERERKIILNLVQEARSAFWRAAAVQELSPRVQETIRLAESALNDAKKSEESELRSPLESLKYRKLLLESLRQLESIQQELATARIELATLMTLPPGTQFTLAVPKGALELPVWNMSLEKMEESALLSQPDMREMAYQGRIVIDESRKSLLKLFPGISLSTSRQWNTNSYSLNKNWYDAGVRVTWNLLNILSAPSQLAYNRTSENVMEIKRLALRMALLSQVHVAYRHFELSRVQLQRSDDLFVVETEIAKHIENRVENDVQSVLDRIASNTSAILAELRRFQALAQAHSALGKMMASTGIDPDVAPIQDGTLQDLTTRVAKWMNGQILAPTVASVVASPIPSVVSSNLTVGETGTVRTNTVVRSGHGMDYQKMRILHPGDLVTIQERSLDQQWGRIGDQEWIFLSLFVATPHSTKSAVVPPSSDVVQAVNTVSPNKVTSTVLEEKPVSAPPASAGKQGTLHTDVYVRSGHGMEYRKVRALQAGTSVTIHEVSPDGLWLRIGKKEWIFHSYVMKQ